MSKIAKCLMFSTAICVFLKKSVSENGVPFEIKENEQTQLFPQYRQFSEFQHQHLGSFCVEFDGSLLVGASAFHG